MAGIHNPSKIREIQRILEVTHDMSEDEIKKITSYAVTLQIRHIHGLSSVLKERSHRLH